MMQLAVYAWVDADGLVEQLGRFLSGARPKLAAASNWSQLRHSDVHDRGADLNSHAF
jgi:hypothetical protein